MDAKVEVAARRFAAKKNVDPALFLAVVEVECPWEPFEQDGVTPRFLFERHKFYQYLVKLAPEQLQEAIDAGLAIPKWSRATQYKDLGTSKGRMKVLQAACKIHMEAAYCSISMGIGQVMGFNAAQLGYGTATQMFSTLRAGGIAAQLDAMWRFMQSKPGMLDALKAGNWALFARLYNGPAYAQNDYDTRLEAAAKRFADEQDGRDPYDDDNVPLGRTPVQNAEGPNPWMTPEGVATGVATATGAGTALTTATKTEGPVGYALAFVIVGAFIVGAYFFIKRLRRHPE